MAEGASLPYKKMQTHTAMKYAFWIFAACWMMAARPAHAQQQDFQPPKPVIDGLYRTFQGDPFVLGWRPVEEGFLAVFSHQNVSRYSVMGADGRWVERGSAIDIAELPEGVANQMPELDITAFLLEAYRAERFDDTKGYFLVYETDVDRIDLFITDSGKVIRMRHYDIPPKPEEAEKPAEKDPDAVDWGGGR
jgi:hypothetical protein